MQKQPWTAGNAIKTRRKALGLSLEEMGSALGVTKAYMSYVESDERALTEDQASSISKSLGIPIDLLLLSSGRLPSDVLQTISADAAGVTASIRQRLEQYAITYPSQLEIPLESIPDNAPALASPSIPERINVSKTTSSYRAHSYHTKVPPEAITPFIRAFTNPGDLILDPFSGSGMTGVAALQEGRSAILSDLSPAAVHISRNYTTKCDVGEFQEALGLIEAIVEPTMRWLYCPVMQTGQKVEYTTWSDVFECGACKQPILYWDVVQTEGGTDARGVTCPHCQAYVRKSELHWLEERPVQTHVSAGSTRITTHSPTEHELALIEETGASPIPYWIPNIPFGSEREMWRASHKAMGITNVSDFFTRRNLHALAALRHAIVTSSEGRVREALMFAFTACVNRASKRYQWNAKRPTNVMTGTLYVSSLRYEWNVWSLFRRKAADVRRYFESFPVTSTKVQVMNRSATDLTCIPNGSISMVFMDPPFGSNIFYADCSMLWEAWLGTMTDNTEEMVVNKSRARVGGGKTLSDYGSLMTSAFCEVSRVLKPGGYAVLAFSNADDQVWLEIQNAMLSAGLHTSSVHILDKGQPSIKGVKGISGKERVTCLDLLITMQHQPADAYTIGNYETPSLAMIDAAIMSGLSNGDGRTDQIYSAVLLMLLTKNKSLSGVTMPMVSERCIALGAVQSDGKWILPLSAPTFMVKEHDLVSEYLSNKTIFPKPSLGIAPLNAPISPVISGGRNSALYTAHSYHTKVPPEAITPFIEYFTKPGDVILDPFCGSGMTGVAAAMAGRNCILNDLSPAAVHLAWNHTNGCDPEELENAFAEVEEKITIQISEIYSTAHSSSEKGLLYWTMWSSQHQCPGCRKKFLLWEAMDRSSGRMGPKIQCPKCGIEIVRRELSDLGSLPAWVSYKTANGKRFERAANENDVSKALSYTREDIKSWYPSVPIGPDREMYIRCALHLKGIEEIADFYTPRNLHALAILWKAIGEVKNTRSRLALTFAFTNTAWHGTRMRRYNARGGQRPLTGTLYIPQLSSEANVLEVMRNKIAQLKRYYAAYQPRVEIMPCLLNGSATSLTEVEDGSIDYVFTDPPFGSNLFYADCNLIWESWLGRITNPMNEAVVNRSLNEASGGKSIKGYGDLMTEAMLEIARVLKPGGWATVVFHNTDGNVWAALKDAAEYAGFEFHEAASLDRKQQSHKGYKGRSGLEDVAHFDVVMNLRKPSKLKIKEVAEKLSQPFNLNAMVAEISKDADITSRGLQGVHAEVMRRLASVGQNVFVDYADVRKVWEQQIQS